MSSMGIALVFHKFNILSLAQIRVIISFHNEGGGPRFMNADFYIRLTTDFIYTIVSPEERHETLGPLSEEERKKAKNLKFRQLHFSKDAQKLWKFEIAKNKRREKV